MTTKWFTDSIILIELTPEDMTTEELRKLAHEAPMNKIHKDHKGRTSLATHSMAWAKASQDWMDARDKELKMEEV